jgi:hypothetical protein
MKCKPAPKVLAAIRRLPCCVCGRPAPSEAAHLWPKGMGGAYRNDSYLNLAPLCRLHHQSHHDGNGPDLKTLVRKVSERTGMRQNIIRAFNLRVREAPKGSDVDAILRELIDAAAKDGGGARCSHRPGGEGTDDLPRPTNPGDDSDSRSGVDVPQSFWRVLYRGDD